MITLITGGARSGKSRYAQELALSSTDTPVYVATARVWDKEFEARVTRHQSERDERWTNIEEERDVSRLAIAGKVAVIDCVTLWLTNLFVEYKSDLARALQFLQQEIDALYTLDGHFIIITNEIGMGVHAETEAGRKFTDLQGWANQYIASKAARVVFMVSGIPMIIKDERL